MAYNPPFANPLHTPVPHSTYSAYSIASANAGQSHLTHTTRGPLTQGSHHLVSKWSRTMGPRETEGAIHFDWAQNPGHGIPMHELMSRGVREFYSVVANPHDPVLAHVDRAYIMLRILWPGYPQLDCTNKILLHPRREHITRAELAHKIAMIFYDFVQHCQNKNCASDAYRLGPMGISFYDLSLVALKNVWNETWQADVSIIH